MKDATEKYQKVMNLQGQIALNLMFDELVDRVLGENPKNPINGIRAFGDRGQVTGKFDPATGDYTFKVT